MKRILTTLAQKWPEYLLEVFVITVGILGAYALNNWNEERKEDKLELKLLREVQKSVVGDSDDIAAVILSMKNSRELAIDLKARMKADEPYSDTLDYLFSRVSFVSVDASEDYAFGDLEETGYSVLESDTLRKMIPRYFEYKKDVSRISDTFDLMIYFRDRIFPKYFESFDYAKGSKPRDWEALKKEDEIYVAIDYVINDTRYYRLRFERLLELNQQMVLLISQELKARK